MPRQVRHGHERGRAYRLDVGCSLAVTDRRKGLPNILLGDKMCMALAEGRPEVALDPAAVDGLRDVCLVVELLRGEIAVEDVVDRRRRALILLAAERIAAAQGLVTMLPRRSCAPALLSGRRDVRSSSGGICLPGCDS